MPPLGYTKGLTRSGEIFKLSAQYLRMRRGTGVHKHAMGLMSAALRSAQNTELQLRFKFLVQLLRKGEHPDVTVPRAVGRGSPCVRPRWNSDRRWRVVQTRFKLAEL